MSELTRGCNSDSDHGSAVAFWNVAVVHLHNDAARCCASPPPDHCRSITAACCGTGVASASGPATAQPEADRSREPGAIFSPPYVSDSRLKVLHAQSGAKQIAHPAADRTALREADRSREPGAIFSPPYVSDSRLKVLHAQSGAKQIAHPAADRTALR